MEINSDKTLEKLKNPDTKIVKRESTIYDLIKQQQPAFKLALPSDWDADRFTRIAITSIKSNPNLQRCEPMSLIGSLMLSAQLGLEPNSPLQEAYLIPYKNQCQYQIGYRGLLKLAWNSGMIEMIDFDKICEKDTFEYQKGFEQLFIHKPLIKGDRGNAIAYYAIAQIKGGGKAMFIASKDDILKHAKKFSKTFNNGPWQSDFDSMAIKTVLKQLIDKKLPKATTKEMLRLMEAINRDDTAQEITKSQLGNDKIDIEDIVTIADYEVIQETGEIKESQEPKDTLL